MKLTSDSTSPPTSGNACCRVYLVSGDEPLLTGEAASMPCGCGRAPPASPEREVHFIERVSDWDAVRASAANLSLFGSRRVLEIRLATGKPRRRRQRRTGGSAWRHRS